MNNRELASVILLGAGFIWACSSRSIRQAMWGVLKAATAWKVMVSLLALTAWMAVAVLLAYRWGWWTPDLGYATVLWYLTGAIGWVMNVRDAGSPRFIIARVRGLITLGVFLEFFVNLYVFPLLVELILQPALVTVALVAAFSGTEARFAQARKLLNGLLAVIGIALLGITVFELTTSWKSIDLPSLARQFLLPVWLTLWTLPFVYVFTLVTGYEVLLQRVRFRKENDKLPWYLLFGLASTLGLSRTRVHALKGRGIIELGQARSFGEVRSAVQGFEASVRDEDEAKRIAKLRLEQYAGVKGRRAGGRLLDRREFKETKDALEWVAVCHEGWYRRGKSYRRDLMDVLSDLTSHGLPEGHGITMRVRRDGQGWYAFRQTPSGHWFGIGATKPRAQRWYYDGSVEPAGFPTRRDGWSQETDETRTEWLPEDPV